MPFKEGVKPATEVATGEGLAGVGSAASCPALSPPLHRRGRERRPSRDRGRWSRAARGPGLPARFPFPSFLNLRAEVARGGGGKRAAARAPRVGP